MQGGASRLQYGPLMLLLDDCRVAIESYGVCFRHGQARSTMIVSEMLKILINSLLSK